MIKMNQINTTILNHVYKIESLPDLIELNREDFLNPEVLDEYHVVDLLNLINATGGKIDKNFINNVRHYRDVAAETNFDLEEDDVKAARAQVNVTDKIIKEYKDFVENKYNKILNEELSDAPYLTLEKRAPDEDVNQIYLPAQIGITYSNIIRVVRNWYREDAAPQELIFVNTKDPTLLRVSIEY